MRLFIGLPIPADHVDALWPLQDGVPGADWTDPEDHHLTLVFLGEVAPDRVRDLGRALDAVRFAPFDLAMAGLGHFPPRGKPRTLWAGVQPCDALQRLQAKVARTCAGLGIPLEVRQFLPHVTLARLRDSPPHRVAQWLGGHVGFSSPPWTVDQFVLYRSSRQPGVQHYDPLHRVWAAGCGGVAYEFGPDGD
ncbi:MAG: RNA 2',3'-cyclic phosphodiesterase [Deltaproteobacteria bacterium]|nr:RNA 2',3'-cyclic phosphodiesterase [Deltaproteobacteria bacterium]